MNVAIPAGEDFHTCRNTPFLSVTVFSKKKSHGVCFENMILVSA